MIHENQEYKDPANNILGVFAGMLIGGLAGAVTMLLMAPQSGKDTRRQLQEKGIQLRDQTTELVENTVGQLRTKPNKITEGVGLKDRSQELSLKRLGHVSEAAQAGKKAIQSA